MLYYVFLLLSVSEKVLIGFNRKLLSITSLVHYFKGFYLCMFWNSCDREMSGPCDSRQQEQTPSAALLPSSEHHPFLKILILGYSCGSSQVTEEHENRCRVDFHILFCVCVYIYICMHAYILTQFYICI